jgi:hypothetical protein
MTSVNLKLGPDFDTDAPAVWIRQEVLERRVPPSRAADMMPEARPESGKRKIWFEGTW